MTSIGKAISASFSESKPTRLRTDVDAFLADTKRHDGKTIIFDTQTLVGPVADPDTREYMKFGAYTTPVDLETFMPFTVISPDGDDFSDNNIIFDINVENLIMRSEEFANLTFEQDVDGLFVTTESLLSKFVAEDDESPSNDNQFDSKFQ